MDEVDEHYAGGAFRRVLKMFPGATMLSWKTNATGGARGVDGRRLGPEQAWAEFTMSTPADGKFHINVTITGPDMAITELFNG